MKEKIKIGIIIFIIIGVGLMSFYFWNLQRRVGIHDIILNTINNCNSDSDCVIVPEGFCGGGSAINKNHLDAWNKYLEYERIKHQGIRCKPMPLLSSYIAKCINNKCVAIQTQSY